LICQPASCFRCDNVVKVRSFFFRAQRKASTDAACVGAPQGLSRTDPTVEAGTTGPAAYEMASFTDKRLLEGLTPRLPSERRAGSET
jgi:hypothetical protein